MNVALFLMITGGILAMTAIAGILWVGYDGKNVWPYVGSLIICTIIFALGVSLL